MRAVTLSILGRDPVEAPAEPELRAALERALAPPHPRLVLADDVGRLLRVEGRPGALLVDARRLEGTAVRWVLLGARPPSATLTPVSLAGRTRKARPTELLGEDDALAHLQAFLEGPELPEATEARPFDGEDGALAVLAGRDRDPRPVGGWPEIARYLDALPPAGPVALALSRPDRHLVGVLGDGARFAVQVRETRGTLNRERPLRRTEPDPTPAPLELGDGAAPLRRDEVWSRDELRTALESLYRFEAPPPGSSA